MRVIAGSKRRTLLETPVGENTRPTQDRIKETLFNMIGPDIVDCVFLDCFAGSGQMGIEALSRGAKFSYFIEQDKSALKCIQNNLNKTKLVDYSQVLSCDIFSCLNRINKKVDFVFMDPPYNHLFEKRVLEELKNLDIITDETIIIVEASLDTDFSYTKDLEFNIIKEKIYKTNKHIFLQRA